MPVSERSGPRVLLTSVFGPFAQDDEFGSRVINPLELFHNQVTRAQGPFSLRMHHRSWGIMLIQENISAPSTVLDFPTRARFVQELTSTQYDVVGISGIIVNVGKVREMCRLVRQHSPKSTIVVGGHVAAIPGLAIDLGSVQTNMVFAGTKGTGIPAAELVTRLEEQGVSCLDEAPWSVRFVTHLDLEDGDIDKTVSAVAGMIAAV